MTAKIDWGMLAPATDLPPLREDGDGKIVTTVRIDRDLLARIDARAKQLGISRTAYLLMSAQKSLEAGL